MLNVWCVCVGAKYSDDYVYRLRDMVARNLDAEHRFLCLTDRDIPGINCYMTPVDWPGWWQKLYLFKASQGVKGYHLYLDLDVVVVGDLTPLFSTLLSLPKNWAMSGHGGCQSSVMAWGMCYHAITDAFDPALLTPPANGNYGYYGPKNLWGDQEFITDLMGDPGDLIEEMLGIYSYKYHCRAGGPPADAKVVCFHGLPKPADVTDEWVINARRCTR